MDGEFLLKVLKIINYHVDTVIVSDLRNNIVREKNLLKGRRTPIDSDPKDGLGALGLAFTKEKSRAIYIADKYKVSCTSIDGETAILRVDSTNPMRIAYLEETPSNYDALKSFFASAS